MLANFQQAGTRFSLTDDVFIIIEIGIARITANFLKTQLGRQSGPLDFPSLTPFNDLKLLLQSNKLYYYYRSW